MGIVLKRRIRLKLQSDFLFFAMSSCKKDFEFRYGNGNLLCISGNRRILISFKNHSQTTEHVRTEDVCYSNERNLKSEKKGQREC